MGQNLKELSDITPLLNNYRVFVMNNRIIVEVSRKICYDNHTMSGEVYMKKKEKLEIQISKLKKIRDDLGMNRIEFSHYVDIPLRTLEEWEAGRRKMPDYVLRLLAYYTKVERLLAEREIILEEEADAEE